MQDTITVSENTISGTLHYLPAIASSGPLSYDGNYLALQFTKNDSRAKDIKVGLVPSKDNLPLVSLDSDMDGVFYISNTNQKLVVEEIYPAGVYRTEYSLSGLTLETSQVGEG